MASTAPPNTVHEIEQRVEATLAEFRPDGASSQPVEVQQAVYLARELCRRARELQTPQERRQQAELDRMIHSPRDKATLTQLTDQAFRSGRPHRAADQLIHILDVQGVPRFFSALDRTLLYGFQSFGSYLPGVAMPFVKERMQHETANVILPAEREHLAEHLRARWEEGVRMNVNYLGEALLGEVDAERRLESYLAALQQPEIEVISVKISTIYSQISALAREHTIEVLCDRLELLFRAAAKAQFPRRDGTSVPKFVYLDMEEYRDKEITAEAFMRTLDRPGLAQSRAGIALQAYIPDSFLTQQRINEWARRRVATGGSPVTIRLVKGANMEAERVEASLRGWPQAPYKTKLETDANYLRMLHEGMPPENLEAVRLGIASHNLFTLAYGLVLAVRSGALGRVQFEMLEGMANHQRRALFELTRNMLLYAPACRQEEFTNAISYLVRRLDENTGRDNFLRHAFNIEVDSPEWHDLERQFVTAFDAIDTVSVAPRRTQDRRKGSERRNDAEGVAKNSPALDGSLSGFRNEPDTDWALPHHGEWAASIIERWQPRCDGRAVEVPLVIGGEEIARGKPAGRSIDPSRPDVVVARHHLADVAEVDRAVECARADGDRWRERPMAERVEALHRAADQIAAARGDLLGAMMAEGGKLFTESDPEVSEAIDFCRFYAVAAHHFHGLFIRTDHPAGPGDSDGQDGPSHGSWAVRGRGVVAVISPWNFPLAIPCGGVAAALAAGNTAILKPSPETVLVAHRLCECFWGAGVPKTALQFVPCQSDDVAQSLATHRGVDAVVFTGGTATAAKLLAAKPTIDLLAETGGKNATIVTALSDRDSVIKNVLHSALSHSGQKCSATSLLILESEVFHDEKFREAFCDAVGSLRVGSAWELPTRIVPLIRPPTGVLETGLKELEAGETWAVRPRLHVGGNRNLVSPGVKWGVQPGSFTHMTELFGPVLGVMEARDLDEAIELVNATGYGLTSGLESLDDREHEVWSERIRAGNLYINRPTTGAIVLRQPFGGMGKSAVGPGIKAGGPNYVVPLMRFDHRAATADRSEVPVPADLPGSDGDAADAITRQEEAPAVASLFSRPRSALRPELLTELHRALLDRASTAAVGAAEELRRVLAAIGSYRKWAREEFHQAHDHFRLLGEDNVRRYLPVEPLRIRVHPDDTLLDVFCRAAAARAAGCRATVSVPLDLAGPAAEAVEMLDRLTDSWGGAIEFIEEDDALLAEAIRGVVGSRDLRTAGGPPAAWRLRYAAPDRVPLPVRAAAAEALQYIADAPVCVQGRVELLWYFREQSISHVYHRYGNLGLRADEPRDEPM